MNTQTPALGAQPEQDTLPSSTEASAQPPTVNADDYTADQLLEALTGEPQAKAPLDKLPDPEAPSAQPEPAAKDAQPKENTPARKENLRLRFTALTPEQQDETAEAYRMVREGEAPDMLAAYQAIRGIDGQPEQAAQEKYFDSPALIAQQSEENAATTTEVDDLFLQLADLRSQRKQAREDYDMDAEEDLSTQIENLSLKIAKAEALAELSQRTEAQSRTQWNQEYDTAVDELESKYPDVLDDNSTFTRFLDAKIKAAKADSDPRLSDPRHVLLYADELAAEIQAIAPKPSGIRPSPPPSAPRPNGSSVAPAQNSAQRMSDQQAAAMFYDDKTSADDILAALCQ
jgi:hypothetical protein